MSKRTIFLVLLCSLVFETPYAQERNPTVYPYGGFPDSSRFTDDMRYMRFVPLIFYEANFYNSVFNSEAYFMKALFDCSIAQFALTQFKKQADFSKATFNCTQAYFFNSRFDERADFVESRFHCPVGFSSAKFNSDAIFAESVFDSSAGFQQVEFNKYVSFSKSQFNNSVDFSSTKFKAHTDFIDTKFGEDIVFGFATFDSTLRFENVIFDSTPDFRGTKFRGEGLFFNVQFRTIASFNSTFSRLAVFGKARFDSTFYFDYAKVDSLVIIINSVFCDKVIFSNSDFGELGEVDFSYSTIGDTVLLGSSLIKFFSQRYDFSRARLLPQGKHVIPADTLMDLPEKQINFPGAKIILLGPADIKIQLEKFKFLELAEKLDFYSKKDIITNLKELSFKGEQFKRERFELDYIFAKSTRYQKDSAIYEKYSIFNPVRWWRCFYDLTLGLGYRPFRILYLIIGIIVGFGIYYLVKWPTKVSEYISRDDDSQKLSEVDTHVSRFALMVDQLIKCIYFSSMVFLTFRLKRDILFFFEIKQKRFIVSEWLLGILILFYFLYFAEEGSILNTLKSLIVG